MPLAPRYTWGRNRWPVYFWRGVGIVIIAILVTADLSPRPVLFTNELSFEVVQQMEEAGDVCRGARDSEGSSCAVEVWKACHMAKQELDNSHEMPTKASEIAASYLCDAAVIADASELGAVLASRYGDEYFREGFYKITETDRGNASFLAFHDLVNSEFDGLVRVSFTNPSFRSLSSLKLSDLASNPYIVTKPKLSETSIKLNTLLSSISDFFEPYRNYGSGDSPSGRDWWVMNVNPWKKSDGFVNIQGIPEQNCSTARIAVREKRLGWKKSLDNCLHSADACEKRADRFSASCSFSKGAAEFENMWQMLPEVCAMTYEKVNEPTEDTCHQAALDICEYEFVSPEDEWLGQLISMRDFACTAASRTPDLQFVKMAAG